jgi:hypothetical protein
MTKTGIAVVIVVQNDAETIGRVLASVYEQADTIVVASDPWKGWSGVGVSPDETRQVIEGHDTARKITFLEGDFFRSPNALENETFQRQVAADLASRLQPDATWIFQVDADEEFVDFDAVVRFARGLPARARCLRWAWIPLFQILDDGRFLVVVDREGRPIREKFYLAHRPHARLVSCRIPALVPFKLTRTTLRVNEVVMRVSRPMGLLVEAPPELAERSPALHYTLARSERRVVEKLATWGHSQHIDAPQFLALWRRSKVSWADITDFHPTLPRLWPALRPATLQELRVRAATEHSGVARGGPHPRLDTR